jgi:phenylacetate-CoA ligase
VAPGETGHVVVTDLLNEAMPFIRYRMEDMRDPCRHVRAAWSANAVAYCRTNRRLSSSAATAVRSRAFHLIENTLTRIQASQMQIVQENLCEIQLRIVRGPAFDEARQRELVDYFQSVFPGAQIVLQETTAISQERNGKYRLICRVPD